MPNRVPNLLGVVSGLLAALGFLGVNGAASGQQPSGAPPQKDLPGAFQSLRITPPRTGDFFCPVDETGLHPGVLVFLGGLQPPAAATDTDTPAQPAPASKVLPALLDRLDKAIGAYPEARMGGFVILLNDGGYRAALLNNTGDLDNALNQRDAQAATLQGLAKDAGVKGLVLSLGINPEGMKGYALDANAVTVIVYTKDGIVSRTAVPQDKLTAGDVDRITSVVDATAKEAQDVALLKKKK